MKRLPIPMTFTIVVAATIALVIFFGAWAVSLDASGQGRGMSFAVPGGGSSMGAVPSLPDAEGRVEASEVEGEGPAETWWGKAFLNACPLH